MKGQTSFTFRLTDGSEATSHRWTKEEKQFSKRLMHPTKPMITRFGWEPATHRQHALELQRTLAFCMLWLTTIKVPKGVRLMLCQYIAAANFDEYASLPWPIKPNAVDQELCAIWEQQIGGTITLHETKPTLKMHLYRMVTLKQDR